MNLNDVADLIPLQNAAGRQLAVNAPALPLGLGEKEFRVLRDGKWVRGTAEDFCGIPLLPAFSGPAGDAKYVYYVKFNGQVLGISTCAQLKTALKLEQGAPFPDAVSVTSLNNKNLHNALPASFSLQTASREPLGMPAPALSSKCGAKAINVLQENGKWGEGKPQDFNDPLVLGFSEPASVARYVYYLKRDGSIANSSMCEQLRTVLGLNRGEAFPDAVKQIKVGSGSLVNATACLDDECADLVSAVTKRQGRLYCADENYSDSRKFNFVPNGLQYPDDCVQTELSDEFLKSSAEHFLFDEENRPYSPVRLNSRGQAEMDIVALMESRKAVSPNAQTSEKGNSSEARDFDSLFNEPQGTERMHVENFQDQRQGRSSSR